MNPAIAKYLRFRTLGLMLFIASMALLAWSVRRLVLQDQEVLWRAERLQDREPRVREEAMIELASFITTPDQAETLRPTLLKLLRDPDPRIRLRALGMLTDLAISKLLSTEGIVETRSLVRAAMRDRDPRIRATAAACYLNLEPLSKNKLRLLEQMLDDEDADVRSIVYTGLITSYSLPTERREAWLLRALKDPSRDVRLQQLNHLSDLSAQARPVRFDSAVLAALGELLQEGDSLGETAVALLERLQRPVNELEPALTQALESPNQKIALGAAHLLVRGSTAGERTRRALLRLIETGDSSTSSQAAWMLQKIGAAPEHAALLWRTHVRWNIKNDIREQHDWRHLQWKSAWTATLLSIAPNSDEGRRGIVGLMADLESNEFESTYAASILGQAGKAAVAALPALRALEQRIAALPPEKPQRGQLAEDHGLTTVRAAIQAIETDIATN
jgi:hypothetical protein